MIRFEIIEDGQSTFTEWQDEPVVHGTAQQTAVVAVTKLRKANPDAKIRIERTTVIPKPEHHQVRFKIVLPNNETRYSKVVDESEADRLRIELLGKFPRAEVSRG